LILTAISVSIELMTPNKTDVLPYLANNGPSPVRYAKATSMFGATEKPYLRDYMIDPLPVTNQSAVWPHHFRSARGGDGKIVVYNADQPASVEYSAGVMAEAEDVTKVL
jgi:primary-amine oxidase